MIVIGSHSLFSLYLDVYKYGLIMLSTNFFILRFMGYWDDRQTDNGKFHDLEVLYYLADDTMEIRELTHAPSGHIKYSAYVRRGPLPKVCIFSDAMNKYI